MFGKGHTWADYREYIFDMWNFIDWLRIGFMICYLVCIYNCTPLPQPPETPLLVISSSNAIQNLPGTPAPLEDFLQCDPNDGRWREFGAASFGFVQFFAWFALIDLLRYYKNFRTLIVFFEKTLVIIPFFLSGLVIFIVGLGSAFYWKSYMQGLEYDAQHNGDFSEMISWTLRMVVGDFGEPEGYPDKWLWGYFYCGFFMLSFVFANLGIAIIIKVWHDTVDDSTGMKSARLNKEMVEFILDQEVVMWYRRCICCKNQQPKHLMFAEYQPDTEGTDDNEGVLASMSQLRQQIGGLSNALNDSNARNKKAIDELRAKQGQDVMDLKACLARSEENTSKVIKSMEARQVKGFRNAKTDTTEINCKLDLIISQVNQQ